MESKKLKLTCVGVDDWGRTVYKDTSGNFFKDTDVITSRLELCTVCGGFDGEPCTPLEYTEKYKDAIIEIVEKEDSVKVNRDRSFDYMLLDRLRQDCNYYLGNGGRSARQLWATDETKQIAKMKEIYNSFSDDEKPEWLTYEDILDYEKQMISK